MGRFESLTSLALGRGPYDDEVVETSGNGVRPSGQIYSSRGRPRNPQTRRREREHVRAANEVLEVTGIVEDSIAARVKVAEALSIKTQETLTGLRLMEGGRAALVAGVWGVLGLRRRVLLYQPYSHINIVEIIRRERQASSIGHMLFAGIPTVIAYHLSDWVAFFLETVLEAVINDDNELTQTQSRVKGVLQQGIEIGCLYLTLHFRLFATLQQLNLIPASQYLPPSKWFIPFSETSPLTRPSSLDYTLEGLQNFGLRILLSTTPLLVIFAHGKIKYYLSRIVYRPIYKLLPRPTGDSMFSGLGVTPPGVEYDSPDQYYVGGRPRTQDESTLRALEGLPTIEQIDSRNRPAEGGREASDDEDNELQATIISFDVEATDNAEPSAGTWSAELRSANELKSVEGVNYRVTGVTLLPTIMATEGLREVAAGLLVLPLEAIMVRLIGRAYRLSKGLPISDLWEIFPSPNTFSFSISNLWGASSSLLNTLCFSNIVPAIGLQIIATSVVWIGYTSIAYTWATKRRIALLKQIEDERRTG